MSFGTPKTTVHLNITMINSYFRKHSRAVGVHINLGIHLCVCYTTKVTIEVELWSGLIQHKFLVFIKLFHWNILLHFKENMCQWCIGYKITQIF